MVRTSWLVRMLWVLALGGCAAGTPGAGDPPPSGSIAVTLSPGSQSVVQGGTVQVVATLTRGGGFDGIVVFTVDNAPAGVTATTSGTGTTITISIQAATSAAVGSHAMTVRGTANGVQDAIATFTLTIQPAAPPAPGSYQLTATPGAVTVAGGSTGTTSVGIVRVSFPGDVTLALISPPTGISGAFAPATTGGTSSPLTLTVAATVVPGNYSLTVRGTAAGQPNQEVTVALTVSGYVLSITPASLTIESGKTGASNVAIARTSFTTAVTLSLLNPPAGISGAFAPVSVTATTSNLTVTVGSAVAAGSYTLTVRGTGGSLAAHDKTLSLTVTPPPGNVSFELGGCASYTFAFQDGTGPWQVVTPVNGVVRVQSDSARAAYAMAIGVLGWIWTRVRAEYLAGPIVVCDPTPVPVSVSATTIGLTDPDFVSVNDRVAYGYGGGGTTGISGSHPSSHPNSFTFMTRDAGTFDAIAFFRDFTHGTARFQIQRGRPTSSGTPLAFNLSTGVAQAAAISQATVTGLIAGDFTYHFFDLMTRQTCTANTLWIDIGSTSLPSQFPIYGIPSGLLLATDFHRLRVLSVSSVTSGPQSGHERDVWRTMHQLAPVTMALPPLAPTPTVVAQTGTGIYRILKFSYTVPIPTGLDALVAAELDETAGSKVEYRMAPGTFTRNSGTVTIPDLHLVPGFANMYPKTANTTDWHFRPQTANYDGAAGSRCTDGETMAASSVWGKM